MRRILFRFHGTPIYSYPAMLYLGTVFGVVAGNYAANLSHVNSRHVFAVTLIAFAAGVLGGRLSFVVAHWPIYRREPGRIWSSEGGADMYGGLPPAVLVSLPLLWLWHVPFGAFWDVATFTILIAMIFTRAGCLLNGCCSGRESGARFALWLPNHWGERRRRIPTQLLEASLGAVLLGGAVLLWGKLPFPGALFLYLLGGYGAGRLFLESTRERLPGASRVSVDHAVSLGLVVLCAVGFLIAWLR
jgi:phosphatidylglycerol:prolipoprotein diacylglycerol transferase